jgi:adenine-specific DNA glycosylase
VATSASAEVTTKVPPERYPVIRSALRTWWTRQGRRFPWREGGDSYAIFLAEMILQKTQVAKAERAYAELKAAYPDVAALANASGRHLERVFGWLGLVKRALRACCCEGRHRAAWGCAPPHG